MSQPWKFGVPQQTTNNPQTSPQHSSSAPIYPPSMPFPVNHQWPSYIPSPPPTDGCAARAMGIESYAYSAQQMWLPPGPPAPIHNMPLQPCSTLPPFQFRNDWGQAPEGEASNRNWENHTSAGQSISHSHNLHHRTQGAQKNEGNSFNSNRGAQFNRGTRGHRGGKRGQGRGIGRKRWGRGGQDTNQKGMFSTGGDAQSRDMILTQSVLNQLGKSLPGSSPDEIDKWVEARKRNWPSRTNVARKLAENARRQKAGVIDDESRSFPSRQITQGPNRQKNVKRPERAHSRRGSQATTPIREHQDSLEPTMSKKVDDALSVIAGAYESSSDEAEGGASDNRIHQIRSNSPVAITEKELVATGAKCSGEKTSAFDGRMKNKRKDRRRKRSRMKAMQPVKSESGPVRTGLLRKLLDSEIRQEQSVLLQAFRCLLESDRSSN